MSGWDDEDYEPEEAGVQTRTTDKWEGEDEDDIPDNWEDSDEDNEKKPESGTAVQVKKKKPLAERIKEREEKKKKELEEKRRKAAEMEANMTPEEAIAEKARLQKLQEDSDLQLAKEALGITNDELSGRSGIDAMYPATVEEFDQFQEALRKKITQFEMSGHYIGLLENLFRDCCTAMEPEDIKKLGSTLNTLANEKTKAQKDKLGKGKKSKKKATLAKQRDADYGDYNDIEEFDDFM